MNRRKFFSRLTQCVAAVALATHLKLGEFAPVPTEAFREAQAGDYYVIEWPTGNWFMDPAPYPGFFSPEREPLVDSVLGPMSFRSVSSYRSSTPAKERNPNDMWMAFKESDPTENIVISNPENLDLKPGDRILVSGWNTPRA